MEKLKAALNRVDSTDLIKVGGTDITQLLSEALIDASAKAVMQSLLSTSFLPHQSPATAIQAVRNEGGEVIGYKVDEAFGILLWLKFQVIGTLVVVSANGLDRLGAADSPLAVPRDVFTTGEWNGVPGYVDPITYKRDPFPFIRFADPRIDNPFLSTIFVSPDHVRNFFLDADRAFLEIAKWTLDAIKRSISLGPSSIVNFGAPFFQHPSEYRHRIGREYNNTTVYNHTDSSKGLEIVAHPSHSSLSDNPNSHLSLILHPLRSTAVLNGLLDPYDPRVAGFDTNKYTPSAYITEVAEQDWEMLGLKKETRGLKRKRGIDTCTERIIKRGRKTRGAL
ncbi:hypothetical protein PQX77_016185 [Marasmius sp. AFHP31]|nr:hypothetical protein PQX77_016185 [Marasmius sp. AFHP31]